MSTNRPRSVSLGEIVLPRGTTREDLRRLRYALEHLADAVAEACPEWRTELEFHSAQLELPLRTPPIVQEEDMPSEER